MKLSKPRVGFLGLSLELYQEKAPDIIKPLQENQKQLETILNEMANVVESAFCITEDVVEKAVRSFENKGADVIVVTTLSYSPSLISVPSLKRSPLPVLVWNTQKLYEITPEFSAEDTIENHGMHGAQDMANVLRRSAVPFGICSGHMDDPNMIEELEGWLHAAAAAREAQRTTVAQFGHPFVGMGDFGIDETAMRMQWGPAVCKIGLEELGTAVEAVSKKDVRSGVSAAKKRFAVDAAIPNEVLEFSVRQSIGLRRVLEERDINAFTMNFQAFGFDGGNRTAPFYGINLLMEDGFGYAGEGNVTVAALVRQLSVLTGKAAFTEMFTADYANDEIMMCHMGEGNLSFARSGADIEVRSYPFRFGGEGALDYCTHAFPLEPGPVTLVNITNDADGSFYMITSEVEVADHDVFPGMTMPHFKVATPLPLRKFLDRYGMAGGTHHLAMVVGHRAKDIRKLARFQAMKVETVC